jgi:L,D-transpeptidase ErfK/SrfK
LFAVPFVGCALAGGAGAAPAEGIDYVGEQDIHLTRYEDTLPELARRYDLGFAEIVAANPGIDPWMPGDGAVVTLPLRHLLPDAPRRGIVINLGEMRLYHYAEPDALPRTYPIGVGREGRATPLGQTTVVRKLANPTWTPTASVRAEFPDLPATVPPGPENPLGEYALYLGWPTYLIHGTNRPFGIGRRVTAGCIRLYPEDIETLFAAVEPGTPVTVVDQQVKVGWIDGELYVEVHPSMAQVGEIEATQTFTPELPEGIVGMVMAAAGAEDSRVDLALVMKAGLERRGYPMRVTR